MKDISVINQNKIQRLLEAACGSAEGERAFFDVAEMVSELEDSILGLLDKLEQAAGEREHYKELYEENREYVKRMAPFVMKAVPHKKDCSAFDGKFECTCGEYQKAIQPEVYEKRNQK